MGRSHRQVPRHHQPRVNPDPHRELHPPGHCQACIHLRQGSHDPQPGPHRPLGVVVVGLRIAKADERPITQELGDIASIAGHHCGTGLQIGLEHGAVVFGVQLAGERRRVHEVAKQQRDLAPLSVGCPGKGCGGGILGGRLVREVGACRGSREAGGRRGRVVTDLDRGHHAIPMPAHCANILVRRAAIPQRFAHLHDVRVEPHIPDKLPRPQGLQQLLFAHQPVMLRDEVGQHLEHFGAQRDQTRRGAAHSAVYRGGMGQKYSA